MRILPMVRRAGIFLSILVTFSAMLAAEPSGDPRGTVVRPVPKEAAKKAVSPKEAVKPSSTASSTETNMPPTAAALTSRLAVTDQIGQLMLVTLQGLYGPNREDQTLLKNYTPGGVIIPLTDEPRMAADYINDLRKNRLEVSLGIPMLIGADIYSLTRNDDKISSTFIQIPSLLTIAAADDTACTERLANLIAEHLAIMGFNMNLGPSLELAPELALANEGAATFGNNPRFAADAGCTIIDALKKRGLLSLPMGFPGGGANRQKNGPATLLTPKNRLDTRDLLPYHRAIDQGVPILHVANTLVPSLDETIRPASLSPAVMRDLLRTRMGYKGVIVAGPMDAPDIERLYDPAEAAVLALLAGADMLYWNHPGAQVLKAMANIEKSIKEGRLPVEVVGQSLTRILEMKIANVKKTPAPDPAAANALVKRERYAREAYEIERHAITLVKNDGNLLPLSKAQMPIGVTGVAGVDELRDALEKYVKGVSEQPIRTAARLGEIEDFEIRRLTGSGGIRTAICVFAGLRRSNGAVRLVTEMKQQTRMHVVVVLVGDNTRYLADFAAADAILLSYNDGARCGQAMKSIAETLVGRGPLRVAASQSEFNVQAGSEQPFDVQNVVSSPPGRLPLGVNTTFPPGTSVSYVPSMVVKKAEWDFGDGKRSKGLQVSHVYKPGQYTLTLTVASYAGEESTGTFTIQAK